MVLLTAGLLTALVGCVSPRSAPNTSVEVRRIAFASCSDQSKPQPIWGTLGSVRPDLLIQLGDNIYGDTEDMTKLAAKYRQQRADPDYAEVRKSVRTLATWDDHDYGKNDAGADFIAKAESQKVFCDAFNEPANSPRRSRPGVYESYLFGSWEHRVHVILLDTRYFRSPLKKMNGTPPPGTGPFVPNSDPSATMLGDEQWKWLEAQLRLPAKVRIIVSSIQVVATEHGFEKWGNLPLERERLLDVINRTQANGVLVISGDRHRGEISRLEDGTTRYPLYDVTSSSINKPSKPGYEPNRWRVGKQTPDVNFGLIDIDWAEQDPTIKLLIVGLNGDPVSRIEVKLSRLQSTAP